MDQTIHNESNEILDYSFAPGHTIVKKEGWIIILGHGVTGDKDRPVISDTANALNQEGFDTLRFSFAGNGGSGGDFRAATISKEVKDLAAVIDCVSATYPNIAYVGHSMGAAVGVLHTARDSRISALVSLAGMIDTKQFALTEFAENTPDESLMWDEEACPLSSAFIHDLCQTIQTVEPSAESITVPWLLLHGTADDVVLPEDSKRVQQIKGDSVSLVSIEGADHSFSEPTHKSQMLIAVSKWLSVQASGI